MKEVSVNIIDRPILHSVLNITRGSTSISATKVVYFDPKKTVPFDYY